MADINQIGANIRAFREKKGLTQRTLADNVLVSFQAISAWYPGADRGIGWVLPE